ncbi:MAG: uroporphyrinogen decarboxylase family protein [Acidobacteriota bacterium]|nr:uroporphyrinogen decarboxylase family protein [Acidobacteriota bacterium]
MTSRERVLTVFSHRVPDRVPAWCGASPEFRAMLRARLGLGQDDEVLSRRLGDDFRRVFARYAGPAEHSPSSCFSHPEATSRTPFGVERTGYGYGQPLSHPLANAASAADVERFAWPDPGWMDVSAIRAEALAWGGEYAVLGGDWSPFFHDAIDLFGMEMFMTLMVEAPAVVEAALARMADYYAAVSRRIFEAAAGAIDIFFIGNDFGTQTGPVVGPAMFRRFFAPHLRRLTDLGHAFGLKVQLHCCGGFAPLIPLMIESGIDALQSLQPDARDMEPGRLKQLYGRDIVLNGCLDTHHLLIAGTPDLVRRETRRILEAMKPGGGYIASPSHDYLLPETSVENTLALYETVREFGGYA